MSRHQYEERLLSTKEQCERRLADMKEELNLIFGLKEQLEEELNFHAGKIK